MTDVFEEVEEEIRSERLKRLARNWLPILGGILLVALIAALSWWGWQSFQTSRAHAGSVAYQRGVEALQFLQRWMAFKMCCEALHRLAGIKQHRGCAGE